MIIFKKISPWFVFLILNIIFFHQMVFNQLVPIPLDLLTGGYFPWNDYKWGYSTGVPIKNPALSDVISQSFPLRKTVVDIIKEHRIPLWDPYYFSGTPLLANWQAAVFYPLNILMLFFSFLTGWSLMIFLQPLLSMVFMFMFLKQLKLSILPSIIGAVLFAFSGFMMIFLEYDYSQAGIWFPLLLFSIEKFLEKKYYAKILTACVLFIILSAGNFQIALYSLVISSGYFLVRSGIFSERNKEKINLLIQFVSIYLLGIGLASIQLIPTYDLFQNSIRQFDTNIKQYNYGLLPIKNLLTFLAPDFYGNPASWNFRGFLYHETSGYFGISSLIVIIYSFFRKKDPVDIFFLGVFIVFGIFIFDFFPGRLIYLLKIPLISTSYASRMLFIIDFSAAVIVAKSLNNFSTQNKSLLRSSWIIWSIMVGIFLGLIVSKEYFSINHMGSLDKDVNNLDVSLRNFIFPIGITSLVTLSLSLLKNKKILLATFLLLSTIDLMRFGLKYNPFTPTNLNFPKTPVINFLQENSGIYRIEREQSEVLPPNTWTVYNLMSPSGYDPIYSLDYAKFYTVYNGNLSFSGVSRYPELSDYSSPLLDLAGVKYIAIAKRRKDHSVNINGQKEKVFFSDRYKDVFEDKSILIEENKTVLPRFFLVSNYRVEKSNIEVLNLLRRGFDFRNKVILDKEPQIKISSSLGKSEILLNYYQNDLVQMQVNSSSPEILILTDTYYPGWKVLVNDKEQKVLKADGIYRAVAVPEGNSIVKFIFKPDSFKIGIIVSSISAFTLMLITLFSLRKTQKAMNEPAYSK